MAYGPAYDADPKWEEAGDVYDWRKQVPDGVRKIWCTFSDTQKREIHFWAASLARFDTPPDPALECPDLPY